MSVTPVKMFVQSAGEAHPRRLCLRNPTHSSIAVKIHASSSGSVVLQSKMVVIAPRSYVSVDMNITAPRRGMGLSLFIYSRPVVLANKTDLVAWMHSFEEQAHQLAARVNVHVDPTQFSATQVVIDLPGASRMVESVPVARRETNPTQLLDRDTKTCRDIVDDCATAVPIIPAELADVETVAARAEPPRECWILAPIVDALFPPLKA